MTQTDQVLLDLALGGDADSFGKLVERWQGRVFGFIVRYTGDREDARDLTQDTFAKAYQNLGRLSDPTSFPAWVYKIALNECRMRFRRSKRSKQVDLDEDREMVGAEVDERTPETAYRQTELRRVFESVFEEQNEILQLIVLSPRLAILDETDSGLDVDSIQKMAKGINTFHKKDKALILITHYHRMLELTQPHFVHVMINGKIQKTGGFELAEQIERRGYDWVSKERH